MISPLFVCVSYGVWIFLIPFLLYSSYIGDILSQLAYFFHVDFYVSKLEPVVLCLGLITFYCFVLMGFVFDLIRSLRRQNDVSHLNAAFLFRFEKAYAELRQLFPPFVVSCGLLYVNTTRFDTLRNSLMVLETLFLLIQPIASMCPHRHPGLLCQYGFRSVLFWSLIYGLFPRETLHVIADISHTLTYYMGVNTSYYPHSPHYPSMTYRAGSSPAWIL